MIEKFQTQRLHHLVKKEKMYFGKEMYPCLVCFVLGGGILTAIFIKILQWQRIAQQRHVYAENGEERILPIQEEGDEAMQLHRRRVIQGYTIRPRKLPCQQEETH